MKNELRTFFAIGFISIIYIASCDKNCYQDIEQEIINKERYLLDEWGKGHTMIFSDYSAEEITYFDPTLEKRVSGKSDFIEMLKPIEGQFTIERYEMHEPSVQIHDDVAKLTYNLIDYSRNSQGKEEKFIWNTTEVYCRMKDNLMIIHAHWSFTKPEPHNLP